MSVALVFPTKEFYFLIRKSSTHSFFFRFRENHGRPFASIFPENHVRLACVKHTADLMQLEVDHLVPATFWFTRSGYALSLVEDKYSNSARIPTDLKLSYSYLSYESYLSPSFGGAP